MYQKISIKNIAGTLDSTKTNNALRKGKVHEKIFYQREYTENTDGKYTHEKMFNINTIREMQIEIIMKYHYIH